MGVEQGQDRTRVKDSNPELLEWKTMAWKKVPSRVGKDCGGRLKRDVNQLLSDP